MVRILPEFSDDIIDKCLRELSSDPRDHFKKSRITYDDFVNSNSPSLNMNSLCMTNNWFKESSIMIDSQYDDATREFIC